MKNGFLLPFILLPAFLSSLTHAGIEDGLACEAADLLMTNAELETKTLYRKNSWGVCVETDGTAENNYEYHFFRDSQCNSEIDFHRRADIADICVDLYNQTTSDPDPITFGNADSWTPDVLLEDPLNGQFDSKKWTVSRGSRYSATIFDTENHAIPFMKKIAYREVGECKLEMRIYKKDIDATNLKPILFLHGGSYESRLGLLPMEAEVSHFTEEGYLVFLPFYRLANKLDARGWGANEECREVFIDSITEDVEAAMEFVVAHGPTLGSDGDKVDIFAQSAGGTLATWLALSSTASHNGIELKDWINRLVLLYSALDIKQFSEHAIAIANTNGATDEDKRGWEILKEVFELTSTGSTLNNDDIEELAPYTMNDLVKDAQASGSLPPVFIMHGVTDTLVPIDISTSFCDAYAGSSNTGEVNTQCSNDLTNTVDALLAPSANTAGMIQGYITECDCGQNTNRNNELQTSIFHKIEFSGHGYDACAGYDIDHCGLLTDRPPTEGMTKDEIKDASLAATLAARESWKAMLRWLDQ